MKKNLVLLSTAIAFCMSFAFISCSDGLSSTTYSYSSETDTVGTLDGPSSLTATAYPGMNYISWDTVTDAASYEIWRGSTCLSDSLSKSTCYYTDVYSDSNTLVNGKSYIYKVIAVSSSNPSRAVYYKNGQSSTSCTAIIPDVGTSALDLAQYENGYNEDDTVLTADTITATVVNNTYLDIEFPAKPYMYYKVYVDGTLDNAVIANGGYTSLSADDSVYEEDEEGVASISITSGGTKSVVIMAVPAASTMYDAETVEATNTITIDSLDVETNTANLSASYTSSSAARVLWTPAVLSDGTTVSTDYYKVYRYADSIYTAVTGITETTVDGATYYYVDDTSLTTNISNTYYVALTDGTSYGDSAEYTLSAYSSTASLSSVTPSLTLSCMDSDGLSNDVKIEVTVPQEETLALSYADCGSSSSTSSLVESDYTSIDLSSSVPEASNGNYIYTVWVTDLSTIGDYYTFRTTVSEDGYTTAYGSAQVQTSSTTISFGNSSPIDAATYRLTSSDTDYDNIAVTITDTIDSDETASNYTYKLYRADKDSSTEEYGDYALVGTVTMSEVSSSTSYTGVLKQTSVDDGTYKYMIEKSDSASDTAVTSTDEITVSTIASPSPSLSCTRTDSTSGTVEVSTTTDNDSGYTYTLSYAEYDVDGTTLITGYTELSLTPEKTTSGTSTIRTYTVSGLADGHAYKFSVMATKNTYKYLASGTMASN